MASLILHSQDGNSYPTYCSWYVVDNSCEVRVRVVKNNSLCGIYALCYFDDFLHHVNVMV